MVSIYSNDCYYCICICICIQLYICVSRSCHPLLSSLVMCPLPEQAGHPVWSPRLPLYLSPVLQIHIKCKCICIQDKSPSHQPCICIILTPRTTVFLLLLLRNRKNGQTHYPLLLRSWIAANTLSKALWC